MARRTTRRAPHEPPKVWHNQDVIGRARPARGAPPSIRAPFVDPAPVVAPTPANGTRRIAPVKSLSDGEREVERLLAKLRAAEGRVAITEAANALFTAGHALPEDQQVLVQLLEHDDESRACEAIHRLRAILEDEAPKRPQVLDARLRRLEEFAEEGETRALAKQLRRYLKTIELPPSG
jgi:hypothetical protein